MLCLMIDPPVHVGYREILDPMISPRIVNAKVRIVMATANRETSPDDIDLSKAGLWHLNFGGGIHCPERAVHLTNTASS